MAIQGDRRLEYAALGLAVLVVPVTAVVVLEVTAISRFDPSRITSWAVVGGVLLALAAIALPAVLLTGWQSAQRTAREETTRDRRS
ncbi:hypothetical protein Htur_3282 [Haloterrigena turkmenica DSM 5511]|uniref:Uncharacterized protein n=1 Tax=Haloterrigena turkmenica (strain ATCC 51198 / DSM 5511 / JCM 9101 / NCIMB 13204 / VKM B-1734 / 4k) TaxID=543526 RepID=D2RPJ4_HALTV|nr:hypothetical protein [Haloterrigena turkmenica]ADB62146.1 hypothetical protein Htur_3282 [Haloterrigena turkmenica DSM 5511]